eukprot:gene18580-24306_t
MGIKNFKLNGYIPPERDPEYRTMVKKSLQQPLIDLENPLNFTREEIRPLPREGDVVLCQGKWETEEILGNIRSLRESYYNNETTYIADVTPLKEGKSDSVYIIDRSSRSLSMPITKLKPVKFFYVRSENGYRILFQSNTTQYALRAPSYRSIEPGAKLPTKAINLVTLEDDMMDYNVLKRRLQLYTLQIGGIGTVIVSALFGIETGADYFLGVCASVLYLYLLGESTDNIGETYSKRPNQETKNKAIKLAAKGRLSIQPFSFVSKEQYLSAIGGFLTYRVSLFISEVMPEIKFIDVISILPGSIAEGYRQLQGLDKNKDVKILKEVPKILFITGPRAAGREPITNAILNKSNKLKRWKYLSTDWKLSQRDPKKFDYIDEMSLSDLRRGKSIIYEGFDCQHIDSKVKDLIDEAAKDIIFYKESATKFDHTLVSGWWEDSFDNYELEKVVTALV